MNHPFYNNNTFDSETDNAAPMRCDGLVNDDGSAPLPEAPTVKASPLKVLIRDMQKTYF